jgi:D-alanyl-D-alanine endopeptidase (penicillin-binding protein 7)
MFFTKRFFDFFSSVGVMLLGLGFLVIGPIAVKKVQAYYPNLQFIAAQSGKSLLNTSSSFEQFPSSTPLLPQPKNKEAFPSSTLTAVAVVVVDNNTDTILFSKNSAQIRPLASITKLMSALVLADLPLDWSATTTIQRSDLTPDDHHVKLGEEYSLRELRTIGLVGSSNTAINTLVRMSGTSTESFVQLMNNKAQKLHLFSLHFVEPTGLNSKNTGNALEIVRLLKISLLNKDIQSVLHTQGHTIYLSHKKLRQIWSTNWLLTSWIPHEFLAGHIVGKTGYIQDAGYNFVVRLEDNNEHAIRIAVLGAASNEARFTEARDLGSWIFDHYVWPDQNEYRDLVE